MIDLHCPRLDCPAPHEWRGWGHPRSRRPRFRCSGPLVVEGGAR